MEMHHDPLPQPARDAATVVMLREGAAGPEVFLLRRHGESDVLGGAYVFPGGKVDREDAETAERFLDRPAADLHSALGEPGLPPEAAAAMYAAAIREAFEECGVLFAPGVDETGAAAALRLLREGFAFDEVLHTIGASLQASQLIPWSRWITPLVGGVIRKRFDTRFFVATLPAGQTALHDNHEAVESVWLPARAALEAYRDRQIDMAPPQIMSLVHLAQHRNVESVLAEARSRKPPIIQPEAFETDGVRTVCYPGDPRHPVAERALPGPTRLHWRNKRFEPTDGMDALFS